MPIAAKRSRAGAGARHPLVAKPIVSVTTRDRSEQASGIVPSALLDDA
jgi:hypothetical protein